MHLNYSFVCIFYLLLILLYILILFYLYSYPSTLDPVAVSDSESLGKIE